MPKISIIMPTYNVERYFRQCIESVINQTLEDIEIIPVDDGSPDNCGKIMDEYAAKDKRIKPIHQENGGYGKAVNAGIEAATGEYIGIVETDDYIEADMYEKLYNQAKKFDADVCKCGFFEYDSTKPECEQNVIWKTPVQNIESFVSDKPFKITEDPRLLIFHASIWSNIYKKSFLDANNIRINLTQSASYQDLPFMVKVMTCAERIGIVPEYKYHWRKEENQDSSTKRNDKRLMIMADQCENTIEILKESGLFDETKEEMFYHFFLANFDFYNRIQMPYKKEYFNKLKNLFAKIKNDKSFEYKYFSRRQKQFVQNCMNGFYLLTNPYRVARKSFISIRWNKKERSIRMLGRELLR